MRGPSGRGSSQCHPVPAPRGSPGTACVGLRLWPRVPVLARAQGPGCTSEGIPRGPGTGTPPWVIPELGWCGSSIPSAWATPSEGHPLCPPHKHTHSLQFAGFIRWLVKAGGAAPRSTLGVHGAGSGAEQAQGHSCPWRGTQPHPAAPRGCGGPTAWPGGGWAPVSPRAWGCVRPLAPLLAAGRSVPPAGHSGVCGGCPPWRGVPGPGSG